MWFFHWEMNLHKLIENLRFEDWREEEMLIFGFLENTTRRNEKYTLILWKKKFHSWFWSRFFKKGHEFVSVCCFMGLKSFQILLVTNHISNFFSKTSDIKWCFNSISSIIPIFVSNESAKSEVLNFMHYFKMLKFLMFFLFEIFSLT